MIPIKRVIKDILPGSTKSLWNSVKIAKHQIVEPIPQELYKEGNAVDDKNVCDEFARYTTSEVLEIKTT